MHKGFLRMLFTVGLAAAMVLPTEAASNGEIRITPHREGEIVSGGTVTICRVGTMSEAEYRITGKTGNWIIAADELFFPETVTWIRKHAKGEEITLNSETSGVFRFSNLEAGLYLVTQKEAATDFAPFQPFLVELPVGDEIWEAEVYPEVKKLSSGNPKTADHPAPIIAAMGLVLSVSALLLLGDKRRK